LRLDPLFELTDNDKKLLWSTRSYLSKDFNNLPKFLQSVNWFNPEHRMECYRLLAAWGKPSSPHLAIELLDVKYPIYTVREYAVNVLRGMSDEDLQLYLPQLCQCVKFEPHHDSPLTRFLIERALKNPFGVGKY
jgi:phosphatidylinositol-4,5-bisphosphate 3-kinase